MPNIVERPMRIAELNFVTTAYELPGQRIVRSMGLCAASWCARAASSGRTAAGLQTLIGGNSTLYTALCGKARANAFAFMLQHAAERGANAVSGARYDANAVGAGVPEVLAYGTAVVAE
jgi:uncharacterized protein YbjQ (UPF0145 family)